MSAKLKALRQKRADLFKKMQGMTDKADAENRDFSADENREFESMESEYKGLGGRIEREERMSEMAAEQESYVTDPIDESAENRDANPSEENRGKGGESRSKGPFGTLGEQLMAVYRSACPDARVDKRLLEVRAPTGMNETVPSDGGFLVQKDFNDTLLQRSYQTGLLASRVRRIRVSGRSNGITFNVLDETSRANGSRFGGLNLYWTGEAEQKTPSKPKFRQMAATLKRLTGMLYATDELLEDTTALEDWAREAFSAEFGFKIDDVILNGTGVGMPKGILNSEAVVVVAKEGSQSADTILFENIINMYSRLWAPSLQKAVWLYNTDIFPQLAKMSFTAGTNSIPVFMPANNIAGQPFPTLMGLPMLPLEQSATLGDKGDLMLVDLSEYLLIDKGGIQAASSIHVRFDYDETAFRFVYRVDGQPIWNKPLTPFKGTATKSPYVALADRA